MPCEYEDCEWLIEEMFGTFPALANTLKEIADRIDALRGIRKVHVVHGVTVGKYKLSEVIEKLAKESVEVIRLTPRLAVVEGNEDYFYVLYASPYSTTWAFEVKIDSFKEYLCYADCCTQNL